MKKLSSTLRNDLDQNYTMTKQQLPEIDLPFLTPITSLEKSTDKDFRKIAFRRSPIDYANPRWHFNAKGINARIDWAGAWVYEFKCGTRIAAYSYEHEYERLVEVTQEKIKEHQ